MVVCKVKKLFGTDGVRGVAGEYPVDGATVKKISMSAATVFRKRGSARDIFIGMDPRPSGRWINGVISKSFSSAGFRVKQLGIFTTPGIAYLCGEYGGYGCSVSASHNPASYNGIKFFAPSGEKIDDNWEIEIEREMDKLINVSPRSTGRTLLASGKNNSGNEFLKYLNFLKSTLPKNFNLSGIKLVIDCANGATGRFANEIFHNMLNAETVIMHGQCDGKNINRGCGSLHPEKLQRAVLKNGATCGIAFDGDGDRVIFIDEKGNIRDGDFIMAVAAKHLLNKNKLINKTLVVTIMSNLGLLEAMQEAGIKTLVTPVGDKYVQQAIKESGGNLGGEQSGHIIFSDYLPTGDGLLTALQVLNILKESRMPFSQLCGVMTKYPQVLKNLPVSKRMPVEKIPELIEQIKKSEKILRQNGRVSVRYSGTEPLLRIMVEGKNQKQIEGIADRISRAGKKWLN